MGLRGKIFVSASGGIPPLSVSLDQAPNTFNGPATDAAPLQGWHSVPYTYTDLDQGDYRVYLQDTAGCIQSYPVNLRAYQYPTYSVHATPVSCYGAANGSLTGSIEGGAAPLTYSLILPDGTVENRLGINAIGLQTGSYTLIVSGSDECAIEQNFIISGPPSMSFSASANYESPYTTYIDFNGPLGTIPGRTDYYIARYDREYDANARPPFGNLLALYSSSNSISELPAINNNLLAGGHYGVWMETRSDIANVTCSSDQQPIEVFERVWEYNNSYCESGAAGANQYRILNFYRDQNLRKTGTITDSTGKARFLGGYPLDGINVRIYTGSASDVNYDPNNITDDKLAAQFDTSGSLLFTGSFSYIIPDDLVVVMKNSTTNIRNVTRVTKQLSKHFPTFNDITASLTVTGSLLSGSDLNTATSDYFGNVGSSANTASLILTMSKENDAVGQRIINFKFSSLYIDGDTQ